MGLQKELVQKYAEMMKSAADSPNDYSSLLTKSLEIFDKVLFRVRVKPGQLDQ